MISSLLDFPNKYNTREDSYSLSTRVSNEMGDTTEFILRGKGSDISNVFLEPINIPTETVGAKLGLKSFATYNNIPNIEQGRNNQLKIKIPGSVTYEIFSLETGAYELTIISQQIQEWLEITYPELKNVEENFKLIGNEATSKAEFIFKGDYGIDFNVDYSICDLLGFTKDRKFNGKGRYIANEIINIANVTQLIFNCSLTESNYINGIETPFLYNCGIDVPVGYRLARELTDIAYKSLTTSQISNIRVWVVDQNGAPVNLRNDDLVITLSLKLVKRVTEVSVKQS